MSGAYGQCTNPCLWMGDLEPYMDETFIRNTFQAMGHVIHSVKFLIDKRTSLPAGYCFVDFGEISLAKKAHTMCNGRKMPNTDNPQKRFKLNFALAGGIKYESTQPQGSEFSLHVSNLSPDVTDVQLFDYFAGRFKTVKHATVVKDGTASRGYGFVRFHVESDVMDAIRLFNGAVGLGLKPIRVGRALPKSAVQSGQTTYPQYPQQQYSNMESQYNTGYGGYYDQYKPANATKTKDVNESGDVSAGAVDTTPAEEEDDDPLEDPEVTIDVDKSNRLILERSEELYRALEASRWQVVDSITTTYDDLCKA